MELNMEQTAVSCLDMAVQDVRTMELTQQLRLPDGMPDVGRILAAWGQLILRGKEWRDGEIAVSGGMMIWILYQPEEGGQERCLDTWIPFQMKWDLPEDLPEGRFRIHGLTRFVDGRSVSPRKIMVRCGIALRMEVYICQECDLVIPTAAGQEVELLHSTYPLLLPKEAGEKTFLVDEALSLPDSAPQPEKLIYSRMNPRITDCRVVGDKLVFRGNGNLHTLYRSEEGQLHSWDFELPFSQIAELEQEYGTDAQADVAMAVTNLEAELDDEGHLRLKCGMTGQYLITDRQMVSLVEDAYVPGRDVALNRQMLELPVILDKHRENLYGEQTIPAEANLAADVSFLPDFPRQRRDGDTVELEYPGTFQVLYYGSDGMLRSATARWEGRQKLNADEGSRLSSVPMPAEPEAAVGSGQIRVKAELPVDIMATARQQIPMVTGVEPGVRRIPDPNRPALILQRAGEGRLWDIAKSSGSTVEDIRRANGLQGEPLPGQMLLIPVR